MCFDQSGIQGKKNLGYTLQTYLEYGLHIIYNYLTQQLKKKRLSQIQYRAANLVNGGLHNTNQVRLEAELGWESIQSRAEILGLSVFHKIHFNLTRPLIQKCISEHNDNLYNLRNNGKRKLHQVIFPLTFPHFGTNYHKNCVVVISTFLRQDYILVTNHKSINSFLMEKKVRE